MTETAGPREVAGPPARPARQAWEGPVPADERVVLGRLDAMFAEAPVGLAVFDQALCLVRLNRTLEAASGRTTADVRGRTVAEAGLLSLACPDQLATILRDVLDDGEPR